MMKTRLNCDAVFDVLTAGPFPTGDQADSSIPQHLAACSECRALAEALKPACDLLHEALPTVERASLPVYLAEEHEPVQKIMRRVREQPVTEKLLKKSWGRFLTCQRKNDSQLNWRQFGRLGNLPHESIGTFSAGSQSGWGHDASVRQLLFWYALAATILCVLLFPWMLGGRDSSPAVASSNAQQALLGMALPADCLQVAMAGQRKILHPPMQATAVCEKCHESGSVVIAGHNVDNLNYYCCTECHSVSRTDRPRLRDVKRLVAACQTCHSATDHRM